MQINDLLGADEKVRLKGTVTMFGNIQNITLTDKNIYYENKGDWHIIKYNNIEKLCLSNKMSEGYGILVDGCHINWMFFGKNKEWVEQVFRCIKQCWDEAKCGERTLKENTNNASSTSFRDEPKKSEGTWSW